MIEVDHQTRKIVTEWDLNQSLDETRSALISRFRPGSWAHNNAVTYSPTDDAIIVTMKHQGAAKLDRNNRVKWILSPHKGWGTNRRGESLDAYLLNPLDATGAKITDDAILQGSLPGQDFEWAWVNHCPVILPDGDIKVFDNVFFRHFNQNYITASM